MDNELEKLKNLIIRNRDDEAIFKRTKRQVERGTYDAYLQKQTVMHNQQLHHA